MMMRGWTIPLLWILALVLPACEKFPSLEGTKCSQLRPCGEGMQCLGKRCSRLTITPSYCESHADCQQGAIDRFCYSTVPDVEGQPETYVDNFCVNCFEDAHCNTCQGQDVCAKAVCLKQIGGLSCIGCYSHTHCDTGLCQPNNICRSCDPALPPNGGCPEGSSCTNGRCVNCETDTDCDTGLCDQGVCRICLTDSDCCAAELSCSRMCRDRICVEGQGR